MTYLEIFSALANIATAAAVGVAAWQLVLAKRQAVTSFEDSFAKEYRDLTSKLPTKALLGEPLNDEEYSTHFDEMYHYFDLCNEQVYLHKVGRISDETWKFWQDGIKTNFNRPAFERAWSEIATKANDDFSELKALFPPKPYAARRG
jgi:hypothetical protein